MRTTTRRAALVTTVAAALASVAVASATAAPKPVGGLVALPTPTHPDGPGPAPVADGAPGGVTTAASCASSCIESALVTATASSATVEVATSLPASIVATVSPVAELGLTTGDTPIAPPAHPSHPVFQTARTLSFPNLSPDTAYRITVSAKDTSGAVEIRVGSFTTRPVDVAVETPPFGLDSGAGCAAECVTHFTATRSASVVGRVRFRVRTSTAATITLQVAPSATTAHPYSFRRTASGTRSLDAVADGMLAGSSYVVSLKVKDGNGRVKAYGKRFTTAKADAIVTFHKVQVLSDGDAVGDGEISFAYRAGSRGSSTGAFEKLGTGTILSPLVRLRVPAHGSGALTLRVLGIECNRVLISSCFAEADRETTGGYAGDLYVNATRSITMPELLAGTWAHTPGYGVSMPFGHDRYVILESPAMDLRFRVFATVDFAVAR